MAFEHPSGLSGAIDRTPARPAWSEVVARGGLFAQASDVNEAQSMLRGRVRRVGDMTALDGDRVSGAEIIVDRDAGTITLAAGRIYVRGDVRPVAARTITGVTLAGVDVTVGVRLVTAYVTAEDDPALYGLVAGSLGEGEDGSARGIETISWALSTDGGAGDFYAVYLVRDGTPIDQTPPPALTGINQALAAYDRGSVGGNYITSGCRVTALGEQDGAQAFSIEAGEANIFGYKRTRYTALRYAEPIDYDVETVDAEPHTFADGGAGTATITLNRGPIDQINSCIITKQVTETIVRGTPNNTADPLGHSGATEIISVVQGGTTYVQGTSYTLSGNAVNWAPGGAEPAGGSSYNVTYRYLDNVAVDSQTLDTITVSGGVTGSTVIVGYDWRLPRIDLLCLDQAGAAVYLRGASARRPRAPISPVTLLALAEISNDWRGTPRVVNNGTRNVPFPTFWRAYNRLIDALDLIALERLQRDIDSREPVAKRGVFVDPCESDYYRDAGEAQTAAVLLGTIQLAIDPTLHPVAMSGPLMLDWTPEVVISQPLKTGCMKVNPYNNFDPLPAVMTLSPAMDFWTEQRTEWLSPQTETFVSRTLVRRSDGQPSREETTADRLVDERQEIAEFLREIEIDFVITGFGSGESLAELLFDGVDVTPAGPLTANSSGVLEGTFTIPPNVVAGTKAVRATGGSGAVAHAEFVGQGTIDITVMQRLTTVKIITFAFSDPLAQTWALPQARHVVGVNLWPCAIGAAGNPLVVDLVNVDNGDPTRDILAAVLVDMADVEVGEKLETRWSAPIFIPADREMAHVVKTDDPQHALSYAGIGELDVESQQWVSRQPYTIGMLHSSSNASSWTHHQDRDMTFELVAARFSPTTKSVKLADVTLVDCSDLVIRATVELPTADCRFHFEVRRPGGEVIVLVPDQPHQFDEYVTETVQLWAVLAGTEFVSPTLFPGVTLIAGKLRATGTYVTRAFTFGTSIDISTRVKALLPAGSSLKVEYDFANDSWTEITSPTIETLDDGWSERLYNVGSITAFEGRVRLTLTGTPAARPVLSDLRAFSY